MSEIDDKMSEIEEAKKEQYIKGLQKAKEMVDMIIEDGGLEPNVYFCLKGLQGKVEKEIIWTEQANYIFAKIDGEKVAGRDSR